MRRHALHALLSSAVLLTVTLPAVGESTASGTWPTLHRDYQRSGYAGQIVPGPYERKWFRDFHDEMIATRCEAIVAEGMVFVGTFAGKLHALDVVNGETVWSFQAHGPIGASPCYRDGRLYFGSDDAFNRGTLYCLNAADGELIWQYATPGGIWTSPACDGKKVYVGDRSGVFHAVYTTGAPAWEHATGGMILKPASFSPDGQRIVVGCEDMRAYCFSPEGEVHWRSGQLAGLSLRDQGPTIWQGLAIVRTNPADAFHAVLHRNGELLEEIQRAIPLTEDDAILLDKWGDLLMAPRPPRREAEIQGILRYLRDNPHDQTFFAFDLEDGSQPWIAPVFYTCGLHNPATPPTFHPATGELYTLSRSALTHYVRGVTRYTCLVRIDRQTGLPDWTWPDEEEPGWQHFPMIPDESQVLSLMGETLLGHHQGILAALSPAEGAVRPVYSARDTYGGIFGPAAVEGGFDGVRRLAEQGYLTAMPNEWHGPDRSICAIAAQRMFWIAGSQVVCIAGPDVPTAPSGGTEPPPLRRRRVPAVVAGGNVTTGISAPVNGNVEKKVIRPAELEPFLAAPPVELPQADSPLARALRKRLAEEVAELLDGSPWAPLVVELGISGEERHFWRSAEAMQIVALALPHLPAPEAKEAKRYLDAMADKGRPLGAAVLPVEGKRREPYTLGPGMQEFARRTPRYEATIEDVYALWAYAHYAGGYQKAAAQLDAVARLVDEEIRRGVDFDPKPDDSDDAAEHLNARIAGTLAAVRLLRRAERRTEAERAVEHLARLVAARIHHERSDRRLVRPSKVASKGLHQAKVPRYLALVPELGAILRQYAGETLGENCRALRTALPVWYQAWGERMIGGENYISPPHLARAVFLAWADGAAAEPERLAAKLDQPWGRADLYYIEKLTATLRRLDGAR